MISQQGAYDYTQPNGSWKQRTRETLVFRLYRRLTPSPTVQMVSAFGQSWLQGFNDLLTQGQDILATVNQFLSPLDGYVLEREYQFVLVLTRLDETTELRTSARYTRDGFFIDTPVKNAVGFTHFQIAGVTHWSAVYVNGVAVDGDAALKDLRELIGAYFNPPSGRVTSDYKLYFLNPHALSSASDPFGAYEWWIHPHRDSIAMHKDAREPYLTRFTFDFLGLESNHDRDKAEDGLLAQLLNRGPLAFLIKQIDGLKEVLLDIFHTVEHVQGFLDDVQATAAAVTDYIQGVTQAIAIGIGKIRGLILTATAIIGQIEDGIELAEHLPDMIADEIALLQRDFPGLAQPDGPVVGCSAANTVRKVRDLMLALAAQPQNFAPVLDAQPTRTLTVPVEPGTTIERIAQQHGTTVDDLITRNQLVYPFVDAARPHPRKQLTAAVSDILATTSGIVDPSPALATAIATKYGVDPSTLLTVLASSDRPAAIAAVTSAPSPGVLYAGDTLTVTAPVLPTAPPSIWPITPDRAQRILALTGSPVTLEDVLMGLDLALTEDGDLVWDAEKRDLVLERALPHMRNVQMRYVKLPVGQLRHAPAVGNFAWYDLGAWQGPGKNQRLAYDITRTLQQDARVAKITNARAETYAGVAELVHDINLINGATYTDIRVPIP